MSDELLDYTVRDGKDTYVIKIKAKDKHRYDLDHHVVFRELSNQKKNGLKPVPKMIKKASKRTVLRAVEERSVFLHSPSEDTCFAPEYNSTMIPNEELCSPCHKMTKLQEEGDLNRSFGDCHLHEVFDNSLQEEKADDDILAKPLCEEEVVEQSMHMDKAGDDPPDTFISSWLDKNATHVFINVMGLSIEEFKKKTPRKVYDAISVTLLAMGFKFSASELYEKKRGLDTTFHKAKKSNGYLGKSRWPYYDGMYHLHNGIWPEGFLSASVQPNVRAGKSQSSNAGAASFVPNNADNASFAEPPLLSEEFNQGEAQECNDFNDEHQIVDEPEALEYVWNDTGDKALLEEVSEAKQVLNLKGPLVKNVALFAEAAKNLSKRGIQVNANACSVRYSALQLKFRREYDDLQRTGAAPSKWRLYEVMFDLEKDSVNIVAPATVSAGAKSKVQHAQSVMHSMRQARERQPNATRVQRVERLCGTAKKSEAIGFRGRALDLQEQRLALEQEYIQEFRSFREEAQARGATFKEGIALLREMQAKRRSED